MSRLLSLIERWPTLRRWLDENQEDAAFLARLRTASREWDGSGQAEGMLWSGQPAAEARRWRDGYARELSRLEQRFLDAVFALSRRARMRRRRLIYAAVAALALLMMAGGYAAIKGQSEAALQQQKAQLIEQRDQMTRLSDELADQKRQLEESLTEAEKPGQPPGKQRSGPRDVPTRPRKYTGKQTRPKRRRPRKLRMPELLAPRPSGSECESRNCWPGPSRADEKPSRRERRPRGRKRPPRARPGRSMRRREKSSACSNYKV